MPKSLALAAVAFAAIATSGVAYAADAPATVVQTAKVNFRSAADVDRLYAQLKQASMAVCDSNSANPRITQMDRACAKKALDRAVRTVDRPILTARHEGSASAFASQDY